MPNRSCLVAVLGAVLAAVLATAFLPRPGDAQEQDFAALWSASRTVPIVSADHAYPPYEYLDNGRPAGFNIELIQTVAEVMGLAIEVRLGPWQKVLERVVG